VLGRSEATIALKLGVPPPPDGPAKNEFCASEFHDSASVPAVVIGDPPTDNSVGTVIATLVTVPVGAAPLDALVTTPCAFTVIAEYVYEPAETPEVGRSALTSDRNAGVAGTPVVGPAKT
jgi:hypothetical protein